MSLLLLLKTPASTGGGAPQTPTRVQSAVSTNYAFTRVQTYTAPAWGTPPTAGNVLLFCASIDKAGGPTLGSITAGWTVRAYQNGLSGGVEGSTILVATKTAVGGDAPPTITWTANSATGGGANGILQEWSGVDTATPLSPIVVAPYTGSTVQSITAGPLTPDTSGGRVLAFFTTDSMPSGQPASAFSPAATGWSPNQLGAPAINTGAGTPGAALIERTAAPVAGTAVPATTFTWTNTADESQTVMFVLRGAGGGGGADVQLTAESTADATDSVSRTLDALRTESSAAGATDSVTRSLDANRAQASAAGAVDAHTWSMAAGRSVSSDAGAADTASRSLDANRGASSDAGATDSVTWSMFSPRSLAFTAAGGTAGAAVTIADTGSGSALDQVSQSTGSVTYEADHPARGNLGLRCTVGATLGTPYVGWTAASTGGVNAHTTTRLYGWLPAYATGFTNLVRLANGGTQVGRLQLSAAGALRYWSDAAGASLGLTSWSLPVGELFRLEVQVEHGAAGTVDLRLFTGVNVHGTAPDQTLSVSGNTGTGVDGIQYGIASGNSIASYTIYLDEIAWSNTTDWIGPAATQGLAVQASAASAAGATDAVTRTLEAQRTVADTAGATDAHSWSADVVRPVSSAAGAVDAASASLAALRTESSSAGATDAASRSLDANRAVSSDAGATDSASTSLAAQRSAVSVAGATDEVTRAVDYVRYASSDAGAVDTVTAGTDYTRSAASDAGAVDTASTVRDVVRTASSTADARDEINVQSAGSTSLAATSTAGATDSVAVIRDVVRYASSGAGATDEVAAVRAVVRSASSSAGAVDSASVSTAGVSERSAVSTAGATDSVTVQLESVRGAVSTAGATDNVTWEMARVITRYASSDAGAVDEITAVRDVHRAATSDAGASDTITAVQGAVRVATSTAGATDAVTWSMTTFLGAYVVDYGEPRPQTTGREGPVRRARTRRGGLRTSTTDGGLRYGSTREKE